MSSTVFRMAAAAALCATATVVPAAQAKSRPNRIRAVSARAIGGATEIRIHGSVAPRFTVFRLESPPRVVVDIAGSVLADSVTKDGASKASWQVSTWAVGEVAAANLEGQGGHAVRVTIELARPGVYEIAADKKDVVVRLIAEAPPPLPGLSAKKAAAMEAKATRDSHAAMTARAEARRARAEAKALREEVRRARSQVAAAKDHAGDSAEQVKAARKAARDAVAEANAKVDAAQARQAKAEDAAKKARHEAARWRQRAKEAQASGASQATAIARRAEAAAREAKDREAQAKAAAAVARTQHSEAAAATKVAEARRARAEAAAKVAEARRARAEAAARQAEASRQAAEAKAAKAENLAQKHALSAVARGVAIAHQHMLDAARRARRDAVAVARRAEAKADAHRAEAKKLASRVARAEAELADLHDETASARARRRREAKKLAQIAARAKTARADIARAATARSEAEAARAKADERLAQAENIRTAAETARTRAETELSRARKARILAETKLEKAEELTAKAEAAVKAAAARAKAAAAHKPSAHLAAVRDIAFVDKDGISRVVISLSRPAEAHVVSAKGKRLILDIDGARIPDRLERTLDTHEMGGAVVAVSSYRDAKKPGRVRVVVDLDEPVSQRLKKVGTSYYWDFSDPAPKTFARRGPQQNRSPKPEPSAGEPASTVVAPFRAAPRAAIYSRVSPMRSCHYRDRIIDLDFKDADIHNLMRLLTDVGGLSIIIPDDVKATVTVRLRRVSWVEAMEVILASKGLWYECKGNLIRVAPRKQLEAEHQAELDRLRALAEAEAPETEVITLNYAVAQDLQPQLVPLLSPKGRIEIDDRTNSLIINDIAAHRRRIIQLVQRLDYQTPQIQIEARIVEARSTYSREIGIQWGGNFSADVSDGLVFDGAGGADDDQTNSTGVSAVPPNFGVNLPAAVGTGSGGALGLSLGALDGAFNVNLRLSALEDQGTVRIVSAPKITVLNNVKAEISDGVSIPISVISANGVQTQFVPADLSLKVTPHVSQGDCSIAMNIEVTKNQPDFANTGARGDPTILRKEARTTILVSDGSTAVIGGVYTRNTGSSYSKVPFFGDIPVLGWLFKSKVQNDDRTEVLIFITPKITNRAFLRCQT